MPDSEDLYDLNLRHVVKNLSLNPGAEIVRYGKRRKDVLSLGQGEGDSPTPDFIFAGAQRALDMGKTFYAPVLGHEELRAELSDYYKRIYGLNMSMERTFVTGSGTTAMHLSLTALLDEGDEVVAITPIWKNLLGAIELAQAKVTEVPLDENEGVWSLDLDRVFDSCTEKTKALLITTPSNPSGWVMSHDEMKAVLRFARERGIWIISDEVYGRVVYEGRHAPSFLEIAEPEDLLFTINSFSKNWAMTGWRLGWLVGPSQVEEAVRDIALYDNMGPPSFTQFGAIEALRHGEPFIKDQVDLWRSNLDLITEYFDASNRITAFRPQSTFYSFFKVDGEDDCLSFARRLIDEVGLSLAPGCAFGRVGKGYMRLCFAVSRERLEQGLDRLETALR